MKKFSDYKDEEAIELWADLIDPIGDIFSDPDVSKYIKSGASTLKKAQMLLKMKKKAAVQIILRVDPTPIDGLNLIIRLVDVLLEIENSEDLSGFFDSARQGMSSSESSGSVTANTGAGEN